MKPWVRFSAQVVGLILWTAIAVTQRVPAPDRHDGERVEIGAEQDGAGNAAGFGLP